jgi:DNA repair photolyase
MLLTIQEKSAKSILTPTGGFLNSYTHSLNPYEGCAFGGDSGRGPGCPFCYVRELPVAKFAGQPWGSWLRPKINAEPLLHADIARFTRKHPDKKLRIFMSSSTDPYQGAEARWQLSRKLLIAMSEYLPQIDLLVVQTRSPLVERDLELFKRFGAKIWLSLTLETDCEIARQQLTPTSASVERRLKTLEKFYRAAIFTQVAIGPLLPCQPERFAALVRDRCHRALVDTFQSGDGSGGRRSERLGIFDRLRQFGYHEWLSPDCHKPLIQALKQAMGSERVCFSQDGFNNF